MPRELTDEQILAVAQSGDSSLLRLMDEADKARMIEMAQAAPDENPEVARLQGAASPNELARVRPDPSRLALAPAAGAIGLGTAMSLATGGLAAPAAIPLVGLAGAGGAGLGLALTPETRPSASGNVKEMLTSGVSMAAGEGLGRGAVEGAKVGSKWLMNRAMNNMASRLSSEFPTISQDMIERAITASNGGYEKAQNILRAAKGTANASVAAGDAAGATIPMQAVTDAMQTVSQQIQNSGNIAGNTKALAKTIDQVTTGRGAALTLAEADSLKTSLFSEAKTLLQQYRQAGVRGLPALKVEAEAKLAAARALNDAIDAATSGAGAPGYRAANAEAGKMIGVTRGLKTAMRGSQNNYQALVRPGMGALLGGAAGESQGHPFAGAAAGAVLGSPMGMSRSAILLGNPAVQAVIHRLPAPLVEAIAAALDVNGAEEPTTP